MLQISILDVDFQGATGRTKFDKQTRFIEPQLNLLQYNGRGRSEVKMIYCDGDLNILPAGRKVHFIDSSFERKHRHIPLSATLSIMICSSLILLLVVTVQLMNIIHRNYKSIKATSHRLNHIVLVGFYLVITGVVAFTVQKTVITLSTNVQTLLCHTVPWCISIGLTLILGTECLKTWRLYWIFNRTNQSRFKSIFLKDFTLCKIVSVIAFLDVLILISWSIGDPLLPEEKMNQNSDGTIIIESQCASNWLVLFSLILGGEKTILMILSLVFSLLTRNIHLKEFETKNTVILVYLLSMMTIVGIPLYLIVTIQSGLTVQVVVLSGLLLSMVCVCLVVLYIPPLVPLLKSKYLARLKTKNVHS